MYVRSKYSPTFRRNRHAVNVPKSLDLLQNNRNRNDIFGVLRAVLIYYVVNINRRFEGTDKPLTSQKACMCYKQIEIRTIYLGCSGQYWCMYLVNIHRRFEGTDKPSTLTLKDIFPPAVGAPYAGRERSLNGSRSIDLCVRRHSKSFASTHPPSCTATQCHIHTNPPARHNLNINPFTQFYLLVSTLALILIYRIIYRHCAFACYLCLLY